MTLEKLIFELRIAICTARVAEVYPSRLSQAALRAEYNMLRVDISGKQASLMNFLQVIIQHGIIHHVK